MEEKPTLRVLLADDQANVRHALQLLLEQEPGIAIVGEAADATGVLLAATTHPADVLLLDCALFCGPGRGRARHLQPDG
jgi:DNA-binding NarL/FixJ family response regulator